MSVRSSVHSLVIVALSLGTTGVAFARNPPALVEAQRSQGRAAATAGYRDSLPRVRPRSEGAAVARVAPGYRDSLVRFAERGAPVRVASR
jgi:hypothetical protein